MTCNKNCIHYLVCKLKELDFANIDECQYYSDFENNHELFSINDLEEMKEIMYDSGGNMKGYGVLMKDIRYIVKTREIRQ